MYIWYASLVRRDHKLTDEFHSFGGFMIATFQMNDLGASSEHFRFFNNVIKPSIFIRTNKNETIKSRLVLLFYSLYIFGSELQTWTKLGDQYQSYYSDRKVGLGKYMTFYV